MIVLVAMAVLCSERVDVLEKMIDQSIAEAKEQPRSARDRTSGIKLTLPEKIPEVPAKYRFERQWQDGKLCGPVGLYVLLNLWGRQTTFDKVRAKIPITEEGCSLSDIISAASSFGLGLKPVRITPEDLKRLPKPCIVHWETHDPEGKRLGHFDVLLRHVDESGYDIVYTADCVVKRLQYRVAATKFTGFALVRSGLGLVEATLWGTFSVVFLANLVLLGLVARKSRMAVSQSEPLAPSS